MQRNALGKILLPSKGFLFDKDFFILHSEFTAIAIVLRRYVAVLLASFQTVTTRRRSIHSIVVLVDMQRSLERIHLVVELLSLMEAYFVFDMNPFLHAVWEMRIRAEGMGINTSIFSHFLWWSLEDSDYIIFNERKDSEQRSKDSKAKGTFCEPRQPFTFSKKKRTFLREGRVHLLGIRLLS